MGEENKSLGNISKCAIKDPSVPFFSSAFVVNVPPMRARGEIIAGWILAGEPQETLAREVE